MLYGYAINVMGKSIEKIDCGSGLSNLSAVRNQRGDYLDYNKFRQAKAVEKKNKERFLAVNPHLDEKSGIYILTREDENGFR